MPLENGLAAEPHLQRNNPGSLKRAAALGAIHALVDAACVMAVWRAGASSMVAFAIVVGYDLLAFAGQLPLGALIDRLGLSRLAAMAGLASSALALLLVPFSPIATMVAAGLGNALFHVGAGAAVLRDCRTSTAPAGLFVAPGALGLALGTWMGKTGSGLAWPLIAALLLAICAIDVLSDSERSRGSEELFTVEAPSLGRGACALALSQLLISVAIRSFVGFGGSHGCPSGLLLMLGLPLVGFAGKLLGGFLADRLGWLETGVGALLLSAPLIAFHRGNTLVALSGLLLFQMTMPVTLVAVSRLLPNRAATAFGLPCLALIAGALPTFFPEGRQLFGPAVFAALILTSAIAMLLALRLLGHRFGEAASCAQGFAVRTERTMPG